MGMHHVHSAFIVLLSSACTLAGSFECNALWNCQATSRDEMMAKLPLHAAWVRNPCKQAH